MGWLTNFKGRRAFQSHLRGNQMIERGEIQKAKQYHDQAKARYEQAYAEGCREPNIVMAYATLIMRYGEYEKSKELLLICDKLKGADAKVRRRVRESYAVCQWRLGNLDKAIELMQEAHRSSKTAFVYMLLGFFLIEKAIQTGDFTEAKAYNEEALAYDEDDAGILDNMGQLYYAMGDPDKAYEYFSRAYREKPTQVPTLYFIAKINLERGNHEKARQFIDKCLEGNFSALCSVSREQAQALSDKIN